MKNNKDVKTVGPKISAIFTFLLIIPELFILIVSFINTMTAENAIACMGFLFILFLITPVIVLRSFIGVRLFNSNYNRLLLYLIVLAMFEIAISYFPVKWSVGILFINKKLWIVQPRWLFIMYYLYMILFLLYCSYRKKII